MTFSKSFFISTFAFYSNWIPRTLFFLRSFSDKTVYERWKERTHFKCQQTRQTTNRPTFPLDSIVANTRTDEIEINYTMNDRSNQDNRKKTLNTLRIRSFAFDFATLRLAHRCRCLFHSLVQAFCVGVHGAYRYCTQFHREFNRPLSASALPLIIPSLAPPIQRRSCSAWSEFLIA